MGKRKNYVVDHVDRNKKDNRKSNLRFASLSNNRINSKLSSSNLSGIIGVSFEKDSKKWRAFIKKNKKMIYLGRYLNFEEAVKARLTGEKKYYKEFAPQKHLYLKYGLEE